MADHNQESDGPTYPRQPRTRPTIGFLSSHLASKNNYTIWQGIIDTARERDVNVISFLARDLDTSVGFDAQANVLYDIVSPNVLDGLIVWAAPLVNHAGPEGAKRVFDRYRPVPTVAIEEGGPADIPQVMADNYQPTREAIVHLIQEHGYRRIAFIRGPDATHSGARLRYQAYLDVLSEYSLPVDPDLVSPPTAGLWGQEVGEAAITLLLDQRHVTLEAVIGANDNFAIGAMQALQARGIQVPDQVAVVGFDDEHYSNSVIPPLTTISLQGYEMGQQATEMLLTLLEGSKIPGRVSVPLKLIIRQSCGCANPAVALAAARPLVVTDKPLKETVTTRREKMLSEMKLAGGAAAEGLASPWAEQLLGAFLAELEAEMPGNFLPALSRILRQVITAGGQVAAWANVISALRRCTLPYLCESQVLRQAQDLWLQAQVMVGDTAQQAQRYRAAQVERQTQILNEIRAALITTFDLEALTDTLARELPRLGIPGCYLSLYQNPERPAETSRLILAYDKQRGRLEQKAGKQVFPSRYLAPAGMLPEDRPYSLVVEALYFREEQLGFVVFEVGLRDGPIYNALRGEISSALRGALLLHEREQAATALERAYSEVEEEVKQRTAELQQEIVEHQRAQEALVREQYLMRALMDNTPDHIYFKDTRSRFIRINKAQANRFGLSDPANAVGKTDFDFFAEEHARPAYADEQQVMATGRPIIGVEEKEVWPDGQETWVSTTKLPLRDKEGNIVGTFGISRDVTEHKQMEHRLYLTQFCVDRASVGIMRTGSDAKILSVNDQVCRSLGYTAEELGNMHIFDIDPTFPLEKWLKHRQDLRAHGSDTFETIHRRKDGTTFPVEITNTFLEFQGSEFAISFVRDISERKQATARLEQNLRETRTRFEVSQALAGKETEDEVLDALIRHAGFYPQAYISILTFDKEGDELFAIARRQASFESGVAPKVPLGARLPASRQFIIQHLSANQPFVSNDLFEDGRVDPITRDLARQGGTTSAAAFPLTAGNEWLGYIMAFAKPAGYFDEEKQHLYQTLAEQGALALRAARLRAAVRESQQRFQGMVETLSDWIWEVDQNGVYTYVSPKVQDLLGYEPKEVLGKTPFDLMPPEEAQRVAGLFEPLLAARQTLVTLENTNRHKDGHLVVFETNGVPFFDAHGRFKGYRGTDRDITERKRAEEQVRQLNEELEQRVVERTAQLEAANKELEAFSYSVSHDLRAPLRAMDGFSRILVDEYASQLPSEAARYLKTIRESSQQMRHLIDDLLSFSRLSRQPLNKQTISTNDLVRQALQSLNVEQQGRLIEISMGALPPCRGDPSLLRQVWINLISNALKFTREQAVARIEVGCLTQEDGAQVFFVKDNGVGFDMRYADKLFGVFQRLHRAEEYEGTGVGLAIVQRIIHRHGGRVWADGEVERGATFYFTLPQKGA